MSEARTHLGPIGIQVCNAVSNPYFGSLDGISGEQFRKILDNNVLANHWLIQLALPDMRARKDGAIIVVSSIGGLRASTTIGAYNISKAADFQLVRNYAARSSARATKPPPPRAGSSPRWWKRRWACSPARSPTRISPTAT